MASYTVTHGYSFDHGFINFVANQNASIVRIPDDFQGDIWHDKATHTYVVLRHCTSQYYIANDYHELAQWLVVKCSTLAEALAACNELQGKLAK